jgi:UDP-3-O-[3-hydroxymyristoyl] glucosamine N-acyltransferase
MVRARLHEQEIRKVIGVAGDGGLVVEGVAALGASDDRCLYWSNGELSADQRESLSLRSGCLLIAPGGSGLIGELGTCRVLEVSDPRAALARVLGLIQTLGRQPPWVDARHIAADAQVSPLAVVEGNVTIGEGVQVAPFCVVGPDVSIGRGSVLDAGVRIHPRVSIGEESTIGANTVLGQQGFGFVRDGSGNKTRIPQLAGVVIGSHVEIGPLGRFECGTLTPTTVEDHAKIGSGVGVGHGARVARGASLVGSAVLGGSSVVGPEAWVGLNSTVRDGRRIGARALVGMDVSVQDDLADDTIARAPRPDVTTRLPDDDPTAMGFARSARKELP